MCVWWPMIITGLKDTFTRNASLFRTKRKALERSAILQNKSCCGRIFAILKSSDGTMWCTRRPGWNGQKRSSIGSRSWDQWRMNARSRSSTSCSNWWNRDIGSHQKGFMGGCGRGGCGVEKEKRKDTTMSIERKQKGSKCKRWNFFFGSPTSNRREVVC